MIRQLILSCAAVCAVSQVFAADLPARRSPPPFYPSALPFTWTGFYIGGQIGYEFGSDSILAPGLFSVHHSPNGVVGGAHVGYNYQINQFVLGLEGDVNGSSYSGSVYNIVLGTTLSSRAPVDGSVRGRLGYAFDRTLIYATGGVAFASICHGYLGSALVPGSATLTDSRVGWTVGGGVEYAVTQNWSLRAEYRYTDYGNISDFPGTVVLPRIHHETDNRVQAGFSYKFDIPTLMKPVVAKY